MGVVTGLMNREMTAWYASEALDALMEKETAPVKRVKKFKKNDEKTTTTTTTVTTSTVAQAITTSTVAQAMTI